MARGGAQLAATAVLWGLQRCGGHAALHTPPQRVATQWASPARLWASKVLLYVL
jgi:hypothetical protein